MTDGVRLNPDDIIISDGRLNYNLQDQNPVDNVSFYSSNDLNNSFHIPKDQVSLLFPEKASDAASTLRSLTVKMDANVLVSTSFPLSFSLKSV